MAAKISQYAKDAAADFVKTEITYIENETQSIRLMLRRCYKNYLGIFDDPTMRYSNLKKVWWPLTEYLVDSISAKLSVDASAFKVLPEAEDDVEKARVHQFILKWQLKAVGFNETMAELAHLLPLYGMTVTQQDWDYDGSNIDHLRIRNVPLLDCFIEPTAESLQTAPSFTVHSVQTVDSIKRDKRFQGTDDIQGNKLVSDDTYSAKTLFPYATSGIAKDIQGGFYSMTAQELRTDVYETYASIPSRWITGKKSDQENRTEGIITCVKDAGGTWHVVRLIETPFRSKEKTWRPFEECWYRRIDSRWYGRGAAEKTLDLQRHGNEVVNTRRENESVLHHKKFVYRKSSGISQRDIVAAPFVGIGVQQMGDVQELQFSDISVSAFKEEQNIALLAERQTGAFAISRGESQDASKTATVGVIEDRNANDLFSMTRRNINEYLRRMGFQVLALNQKFLDRDTVIRVMGNVEELKAVDEAFGYTTSEQEKLGNVRFIRLDSPDALQGNFDLDVDIDRSIGTSASVRAQQLRELIQVAQTNPASGLNLQELFKEYLHIIGVTGDRFTTKPAGQPFMLPGMNAPTASPIPAGQPARAGAPLPQAYGVPQQT